MDTGGDQVTLAQLLSNLQALTREWHAEADKLEEDLSTGKWYGSMTREEQRDFNERRDRAYGFRCCANRLEQEVTR